VPFAPIFRERPQQGVGQFATVAAYKGLLGLRFAWSGSVGPVLDIIAAKLAPLSAVRLPGTGFSLGVLPNLFSHANKLVLDQIGKGLVITAPVGNDQQILEADQWYGVGAAVKRAAQVQLDTRRVIQKQTAPARVVKIVQPNIKAQLRPLLQRTAQAEARATAAEHRAVELETRVGQLERVTAHPRAIALPGIWPRLGDIEGELRGIKGKLGKLGKYGTIAGFLALLLEALKKAGLGWTRCSNVGKVGRQLCGLDNSLLDALLVGTTIIIGTISIEEFARYLLDVEESVVGLVTGNVREFNGLQPLSFKGYGGAASDGMT
jgi:hypothetical protein